VLLTERTRIATQNGLSATGGHALLWLQPWDGAASLTFASLDPLFIEICRRVRLCLDRGRLSAVSTGTKAARVDAKTLKGMTGDAWTPIDSAEGKALTLGSRGFDYKLMAELLFGGKYAGGAAQSIVGAHATDRIQLVARGIARGQGKTEGYHERSVLLTQKVRSLLSGGQRDQLARISAERLAAISELRKLLWGALVILFNNGASGKDAADSIKDRASDFCQPFEQAEDSRFFVDLAAEVDASDSYAARLEWLVGLAARAEAVLRDAFTAGPSSAMQRYRAQSAALSRFHSALRGEKSPLPQLAQHLRKPSAPIQESVPT
jgi:CRISPR system Cascade subunit CasA